jgi:hypothetical protein
MRASVEAFDLPVVATVEPRELRTLAADLGQSRERIETAFVDVGNSLTQCATLLNRITGVFETLPQDLASPELTEATGRLAAVGQRAQEISTSFAAEQSDVARLVAVVGAADHPISDLRRAVKMMGIVAVNARVVAASVVGEIDDFDVFTTDIRTLSDGAARTIHDFSLVYEQLTAEVHKAAGQRAQFESAHRDTLSGLATRLATNLAEVTSRRQASADGSAETGHVSRQIGQRIASAVMAMQVGDATRQRIEHIEAALVTLADLAGGQTIGELSLAAPDHAAAFADVGALQAAQLGDTNEAFNAEVADAELALTELAADAQTVMTSSHSVYGEGGKSGQSPLTTLSAEMRLAVAVLRNCEAERHKLEEVARAVQATVSVLLTHVEAVQDIEANMRLVSLNAAVKCAQLGPRGRALNVIAMQLRELTSETVVAAEAAMQSLGQAAALAQSFSASSSGEAAGQVAWLEQEAVAAVGMLEAVDRRLNDALGLLNRDGPAAIKLLGHAASGFSGHAEISEALADAHIRLESLASDDGRRTVSAASRPLLRVLRKTYTMDAERRIHTNLVGVDPDAAPEAARAPEPELDDLLF